MFCFAAHLENFGFKLTFNNSLAVIVNIIDQQSSLKIDVRQMQQITEHVILGEGQSCEEVNVYFVETETICELHEQFFQDPSPTDCISFPLDDEESPYRILGEVFVCPATAIAYAAQHQVDCLEETILYLVHGLLHLMGYDDLTQKDRIQMTRAQTKHMETLKNLNLL